LSLPLGLIWISVASAGSASSSASIAASSSKRALAQTKTCIVPPFHPRHNVARSAVLLALLRYFSRALTAATRANEQAEVVSEVPEAVALQVGAYGVFVGEVGSSKGFLREDWREQPVALAEVVDAFTGDTAIAVDERVDTD